MKILLMGSAALEAATGAALVLSPSLPIELLLGSSLNTPVGLSLARGVGITLLSLSVAYWLARNDGQSPSARGLVMAMLLYNSAFALLLAYARLGSGLSGVALWPAVLLHTALAIWCMRCLRLSPVPQRAGDELARLAGSERTCPTGFENSRHVRLTDDVIEIGATSRKSPVKFFLLVFLLAIPLWLLGPVVGNIESLKIPVTDLALAFVPLAAAAILVYREEGFGGVKRLLNRIVDYKKIQRKIWFVPLIFLAPLIYLSLVTVMRVSGESAVADNHIFMLPVLFAIFFPLAVGEETGWMGYAIDPMQERWGALRASILLAIPWWIGHFPSIIHIGGTRADLVWWLLGAVAIRIVIVWLYNNTGKSLFAAILFHALINVGRSVSYPTVGSHYDRAYQYVGYALFAIAALIITFLWDSKTLTRRGYNTEMPL